ncbi:MAG: HAD-IA family hydrolase [Paracoccaceae bacterium]
MPLKAIIFDVDGTLSETEEAHRTAFNQTFVEFGLDWVWSQELYGELLKTTGGKERMTAFLTSRGDAVDPAKIAEIHKRKTAVYGEIIASGAATLRPGIADLITDAARHGIAVAVATTTNRPNVDRLTESCFGRPADQVFQVIAAGDEVQNKKPASDVFDLAVRRLNLDPSDCVGLEDSRNGLLSCTGARVPCIVSPGVYTLGSDFSEAAAVIDCFTEIDTVAKLNSVLGN